MRSIQIDPLPDYTAEDFGKVEEIKRTLNIVRSKLEYHNSINSNSPQIMTIKNALELLEKSVESLEIIKKDIDVS